MTVAALGTAIPTPLDPKATAIEAPAVPFADVLAAMRATPSATPIQVVAAAPTTVAETDAQPLRSLPCPPCATTRLPAASSWPIDVTAHTPSQSADADLNAGSPQAVPDPTDVADPSPPSTDHPGEGRGPVVIRPQRTPGLRRGGAEEDQADVPVNAAPLPADAISTVIISAVEPAAHPVELPSLSASPEPARTTIRAAVFNERGLLRDVGTAASEAIAWNPAAPGSPHETSAVAPVPEPAEPWPIAAPQAPLRSASPLQPDMTAADAVPGSGASPASPSYMPAPATSTKPTVPMPTPDTPRPTIEAAPQPRSVRAAATPRAQPRQQPEPTTKRPAKPRAPVIPEPRDKTDARLTLDAAPQGLTLLAAVARTERDDRTRLRDRIAGLLSARGFALADVRVGHVAPPSPKDR